MPEGGDEAVPANDAGAFSWRSAAPTRDSPAADDGRPIRSAREEARGSVAGSAGEAAGDDQFQARTTTEVLADRLAIELVQHEPGWRLPRHTVLARRYNVSTAQIDAAISELADRHLIRRLPDGQVHRVSPVEYLIPLEGVPGLRSRIDPMTGDLTCRIRRTSWRRAPENIGWALHVDPAEPVCVVHAVWAAGGEPAAYATTYLPVDMVGAFPGTAAPSADEADDPARANAASEPAGVPPAGETGEAAGGRAPPGDPKAQACNSGVPAARTSADAAAAAAAQSLLSLTSCPELPESRWSDLTAISKPAALHLEMRLPSRSIARSLRLSAGQPAAILTVRFDEPATDRPVALTVAVLRPELFRIVVQTEEVTLPGGEGGL
jgi:DNA-binding GntR family transcriptional regulator